MAELLRELIHKAREQRRLIEKLTSALIARDYPMAAIDLSALSANTTEIERIAAAAASGEAADAAAAAAAQLESDQAAVTAAASAQAAAIAPLTALFPATTPPAGLTVSPSSISSAVGAAISQVLTVSGGTAPYSFSSSLADVAVDASGNVTGTPAAAETGTLTVSDSSSPPLSATVPVTIS